MIFNLSAAAATKNVSVMVYGALEEEITLTAKKGNKVFTVTTENGSAGPIKIPVGEYTIVGSVSKEAIESRTFTVTPETKEVTAYPDGALYWYGNGYSSGTKLYRSGFKSAGHVYSGASISGTSCTVSKTDGGSVKGSISGIGSTSGYGSTMNYAEKVDLTKYSKLKCFGRVSGGGSYSGQVIVTTSSSNNYTRKAYKTLAESSALKLHSVGVENLSGDHYIRFYMSAKYSGGNGSANVYCAALWLE